MLRTYVAMFCPLHKQKTAWKASLQFIQPLRKIQRIARETCALRINYWSTHKPVCFVLSPVCYSFNISKEQHKKYLCNPSSHYGKYGEYTRETRTRTSASQASWLRPCDLEWHTVTVACYPTDGPLVTPTGGAHILTWLNHRDEISTRIFAGVGDHPCFLTFN